MDKASNNVWHNATVTRQRPEQLNGRHDMRRVFEVRLQTLETCAAQVLVML